MIDAAFVASVRAEFSFGAHSPDHGVVDIEAFGFDIHDLAGLEAAVGAGDGVENTGEFALHVVVAAVAGFGGDGDKRVLQDALAVGFEGGLMDLIGTEPSFGKAYSSSLRQLSSSVFGFR